MFALSAGEVCRVKLQLNYYCVEVKQIINWNHLDKFNVDWKKLLFLLEMLIFVPILLTLFGF